MYLSEIYMILIKCLPSVTLSATTYNKIVWDTTIAVNMIFEFVFYEKEYSLYLPALAALFLPLKRNVP